MCHNNPTQGTCPHNSTSHDNSKIHSKYHHTVPRHCHELYDLCAKVDYAKGPIYIDKRKTLVINQV